jgi:alkylhydroperoxidase family enzyme
MTVAATPTQPTISAPRASARDGRHALETHAPEAARALDAIETAAWHATDADLLDLVARVCAVQQGLEPLARPAALGASPWAGRSAADWRAFPGLGERERAALRFAEQMSLDVSSLADEERAALVAALGDATGPFVQAVWVADLLPRARAALDALFGRSDPRAPEAPPAAGSATLWDAILGLIQVVPRLRALDPVTTELVRLRGARQHACRVCKSLRSRSALVAGANDDTFAAVDHYATSALPDAAKAALAFTDAMIWTPGALDAAVVDGLRRHFSPAQQVELVLDVVRNASNKVAVALAADAARVDEGYEVYDVDEDGNLVYGLSHP